MRFSFIVAASLGLLVGATPMPHQEVGARETLVERADPSDAFKNEVLSQHNNYRAQYGAGALTWSDALYPATAQWASSCVFQHSGGNYGENLYAASGDATATQGIQAWMAEVSQYDYSNPTFSPATGHFTQVVWKSTTQVACALADCAAGTIFSGLASKYLVCRYSPPGNFLGEFAQNVGRHV